jgi:hypothetical protein
MTFDFRVGRGVQKSPQNIGRYRVKIFGLGVHKVFRSKMGEKRRTSFMDVPKLYLYSLYEKGCMYIGTEKNICMIRLINKII